MQHNLNKATLGGGCFWCVEACFQKLKGVESVVSGYAAGKTENPSYEDVKKGITGHAGVVQVSFNQEIIPYENILKVFFSIHDPTQLNKQGNDIGTQYRSIILTHSEEHMKIAKEYIEKLTNEKVFNAPIVTEVSQIDKFFNAEEYHQNYFNQHPENPYCSYTVKKKVEKFLVTFANWLK